MHNYVFIGSSTGGPETNMRIFRNLEANIPAIILVQHMPKGFTKSYADRINRECAFNAKEIEDGDVIKQGWLYICPGDYQTEVVFEEARFKFRLRNIGKYKDYLPSIDYTFESSYKSILGKYLTHIILTGMGSDGSNAIGLYGKKSTVITQDEKSSIIYTMPKSTKNTGYSDYEMTPEEIAGYINENLLQ